MKKNHSFSFVIVVIIIVSAFLAYIKTAPEKFSPKPHEEGVLSVHYLDVGQADCSLILLPNGQTMVIDAGNNDDDYFIKNYLNSLNITTIDYLVGSHPHEDHIGSLDTLINTYDVKKVYMPDAYADSGSYRGVQRALKKKNIKPIITTDETVIFSDDELLIEAVAPCFNYEDLNNQSIVIRLVYKDSSFLFPADAEAESEYDIEKNVSAHVLKVSHHGSSTSTTQSFLKRVDPMYAVISCGENNDYGHPHWETMEKLENDDITIFRTDKNGTIICVTSGKGPKDYRWVTEK